MMRRALVVLSLTVLAAGLVCGGLALAARGGRKGGGEPAPSASPAVEGVVVFTGSCSSLDTPRDKLYVMNPNGTGRQQLSIGGPEYPRVEYPRVKDVSRGPYPTTALVVADEPPEGDVHFLAIPVADPDKMATLNDPYGWRHNNDEPVPRYPVFSPDGNRIAYFDLGWDTPLANLYIADVYRDTDGYVTGLSDGTFVTDLGAQAKVSGLDFSGDGSTLVTSVDDELWLIKLESDGHSLSEADALTDTPDFQINNPRWAPNRDVIAFDGGSSSKSNHIYTFDFTDSTLVLLQVTSGRRHRYPSWSPDEAYLLFNAAGKKANCNLPNLDVYLIRADGSEEAINVTNTTDLVEFNPRWGW